MGLEKLIITENKVILPDNITGEYYLHYVQETIADNTFNYFLTVDISNKITFDESIITYTLYINKGKFERLPYFLRWLNDSEVIYIDCQDYAEFWSLKQFKQLRKIDISSLFSHIYLSTQSKKNL